VLGTVLEEPAFCLRKKTGEHMTDEQKLLQLAARCRHLASRCSTAAIARKLEALALDYEEYARGIRREAGIAYSETPEVLPVPSSRPRADESADAA
jgi:hypothetical protein